MVAELIADIDKQLKRDMVRLETAVHELRVAIKDGDEVPERVEVAAQRAAAGVIAAVGALRALAEVSEDHVDPDDEEY